MSVPTEPELLRFFGYEPDRSEFGVWYYRITCGDSNLRFSFNPLRGTVQTLVETKGGDSFCVFFEGLREMKIHEADDRLSAEFLSQGLHTFLQLQLRPRLNLHWKGQRLAEPSSRPVE